MEKMAPLPQKNKSFPMIGINGSLYAAGGSDQSSYEGKTDFHRYSSRENRWQPLRPMSTGRLYFPLIFMEGYIYAIGGLVYLLQGTATNRAERYDMAWESWEDIAPLPRSCHRLSAVVFQGKIVVYGMKHFPERPNASEHSVMIYHPEMNTWSENVLDCVEDFNNWKSELYCFQDQCYRLLFRHNYSGLTIVNRVDLTANDDDSSIAVTIADTVEQDHMPPDRGAFRIGDQVFILINRHVCPTDIRIAQQQIGEVDLGEFSRSKYLGSETSNVTSFTFDRKKLSNGKCLMEECGRGV